MPSFSGAGEINDIRNLREFVLDGLLERSVYPIIADSMLKPMKKTYNDDRIRVVQSFPIMRNRNCLDFAIIAEVTTASMSAYYFGFPP